MALTQQFVRVTSEHLDRCRASALTSSGASPGWDPPDGDLLDTGWALWGLIRHCRSAGADPESIAVLDRLQLGDLLADMPTSAEVAATVCGFGPRSDIDVREHLTEHFDAMREFYRTAARHTQCVVTWVD